MLTDLIARAWEQERAKWVIGAPDVDGNSAVLTGIARVAVFIGTYEACQAHLAALCAAAVEKALDDAGMVVVPAEPTEAQKAVCYDWAEDTDGIARNEKFYRARIAAG